ncbi:MAG: hypothetical protein QM790_02510 [Nibricoccus sp.]
MITFISSPKPFEGVAHLNQYRAIRSWLAAGDDIEVILYGTSLGIEEAGRELGVKVVKDIQSSSNGIPYFGAIVEHAKVNARYDLQVYLNCDILVVGMVSALRKIEFTDFLLVGERVDLGEGAFVEISRPDWKQRLAELCEKGQAQLHGPTGIDYFAFRRGFWKELPPVVVGRGGYDNALLAYCIRRRVPIIDGTPSIAALHQFHNYGHVNGGLKTVFWGHDANVNYQTGGGRYSSTLVSDAGWVLREGKAVSWPCRGDWLRRTELNWRYVKGWRRPALMLRVLWRLGNTVGLTKPCWHEIKTLLSGWASL